MGFRALLRVQEGRVLGLGVYEKDMPDEDPGLGFWVFVINSGRRHQKPAMRTRNSRPLSHANGPVLLGKTGRAVLAVCVFPAFTACYHPQHCDQDDND